MSEVVWTPQATAELEEILYYIRVSDGRPLTVQRLAERLFELIDQHARGEALGHQHVAAPENWSYFQFKRWLIFYQPHPRGIEIMRVVDGARDLPQQFGGFSE
jgi:plasmid stabilization system protein ParE